MLLNVFINMPKYSNFFLTGQLNHSIHITHQVYSSIKLIKQFKNKNSKSFKNSTITKHE